LCNTKAGKTDDIPSFSILINDLLLFRYRETFSVSWYFRGYKVGEGSTLVIPNVHIPSDTENQAGEYQCEAKLGNFPPVRGHVHLKVVGRYTK
jgi:hypothetical protein